MNTQSEVINSQFYFSIEEEGSFHESCHYDSMRACKIASTIYCNNPKNYVKRETLKFHLANDIYPEELFFDQFDEISWSYEKQFGLNDSRHNSKIAQDALDHAAKVKGIIYTQIDGEKDRIYARDMHFVNRTGIWWVVKK